MDVAVEILDIHLHPIRDWEDTILFYIENFTNYNQSVRLVRYTMCLLLTLKRLHLKDALGLITIIGMLTKRKDLSFPQKLKLVENLHALVSNLNITTTHK